MPTLTDIFAGAGGSSTGAHAVRGVHVTMSANHWPLAVRVHAANFPSTIHACVDLHMEDPRNFPRTDMLWASPECTKWSIANSKAKELSVEMGGDPTLFDDVPDDLISEGEDEITRSRLLMFDVLRFIEHHRYRVVAVENVIDIATQPKYAAAWTAWRKGLRRLGYQFRVVSLNSMHAQLLGVPAPQSRDRLYILAWPEGEEAPDAERILRPRAWCFRCGRLVESRQAWKPGRTVGRYRAQYVYACPDCGTTVEPGWLPASTAIDWSIQGQLIGERDRPLSPKTMSRIREGLRRYGHEFVIEASGNQYDAHDPKHPQYGQQGAYSRVWPISDPLRTLHGTATKGLVLDAMHGSPIITSLDEPLRTQTTAYTRSLLIPTEGREGKQARPDWLPLRTQTCRNELGILTMLRGTNTPKLTSEALDTLAASDPTTIEPEDCTFRMLEPHEIAAGMAFPTDYIWEGTKRERVRLAGNAVTPPAARDIVAVISEGLDAA